jgi:hypothetical protein
VVPQTQPGQSESEQDAPIDDVAASQIASLFELSVDEVMLNARHIAAWTGPNDDLFVWLQNQHGWQARGALAYLLSLRFALHHRAGQSPPPQGGG